MPIRIRDLRNKFAQLYTQEEIDQKIDNMSSIHTHYISEINNYTHNQVLSSDMWTITHNLNKQPSVTIVDSAGSVVVGDIVFNSENQITIVFKGAFSGKAYLN